MLIHIFGMNFLTVNVNMGYLYMSLAAVNEGTFKLKRLMESYILKRVRIAMLLDRLVKLALNILCIVRLKLIIILKTLEL